MNNGQPNRLATGGRIDRTGALTIRFDGHNYTAHPGDTLASALLANGVKIVGRSFKYHRPRGVFAAGAEEPNALVALRGGARHEPNTRATVVEAYDGLEAASQNRWPSVEWDLQAANGLLSRFIPAGFYYKTFIGPGVGTKVWMFFERFIRKAAGIGRATTAADPDSYEKVNLFCDVLVIGAGPAGLAAALAAGRAGARVVLVEQQAEFGGSLLDNPVGSETDAWLDHVKAELASLPNLRVLSRTTVFGAYDGEVYGLLERVWDHVPVPPAHQPRQRYHLLRAKHAVLASGAIERPIVFAGNDLPGVMLASAARAYVNRYAVLPGRSAVVFANNDSAYDAARALASAGAHVVLADVRPEVPEPIAGPVRAAGVEILAGHAVLRALGGKAVKAVELGPVDAATGKVSSARRVATDLLVVSGGWVPTLHLWSQRGAKPLYDAARAAFLPDTAAIPALACAGSCAGDGPLSESVAAGFAAGQGAARRALGEDRDAGAAPSVPGPLYADDWVRGLAPLVAVEGETKTGKAFVDLQNDVTRDDVSLAHREGYVSVEHLKRYTTTGMATDQGKTSNVNALALMAGLQGAAIPEVGTTTFRPPYTPISFGAVAGAETGRHFRPTRLTPIHGWHAANGAVMTQAGLWLRPWYYPRRGETFREAYIRETVHVRTKVGLVDVSTLGKIAVQGPDAAEFLNRVYVNGWKTLAVGRLRYGLMLRDDGFVMDDGATARLGETEYFMTTTTANAAKVLAILENLLQTAWTDLKVQVTSITDQWAAIAVAGPASRRLLEAATRGAELSAEALPNMALTTGEIAGAPVRIQRISFSGELAYEVYVPSGYGRAVWEALVEVGAPFEVAPYGLEALGALRIEKGHVAGGELDGRTTLKDLELEGFASTKKPFVGAVLRHRPALADPRRPSLVGLEVLDEGATIKAGALLFPAQGPTLGHGEGHVTSVTYSPVRGRYIGLGLLAGGKARIGETVLYADLLANSTMPLRVVSPHFYDPEGGRQNA